MRTQQSGTFKKGHKKLGGRQKGTTNLVNRNLIDVMLKAAEQVGSDGKGKDGIDGYFQRLADKKEGYFAGLLRPAVQKQVPATEPENEVIYSTEQDFRQALLDRGVHPTLLPPPPRHLNEKPSVNGKLVPPKPPPGWQWVLIRTDESADIETEQVDPAVEDDLTAEGGGQSTSLRHEEIPPARACEPNEPNYGLPWDPVPGWRWDYDPYTKSFFAKPTS